MLEAKSVRQILEISFISYNLLILIPSQSIILMSLLTLYFSKRPPSMVMKSCEDLVDEIK